MKRLESRLTFEKETKEKEIVNAIVYFGRQFNVEVDNEDAN